MSQKPGLLFLQPLELLEIFSKGDSTEPKGEENGQHFSPSRRFFQRVGQEQVLLRILIRFFFFGGGEEKENGEFKSQQCQITK